MILWIISEKALTRFFPLPILNSINKRKRGTKDDKVSAQLEQFMAKPAVQIVIPLHGYNLANSLYLCRLNFDIQRSLHGF